MFYCFILLFVLFFRVNYHIALYKDVSVQGLPYPEQEKNAMDAVIQFAINELKFEPDEIIMFGWSIGGYTAAWAAVNYPVKALVNIVLSLLTHKCAMSSSSIHKNKRSSFIDSIGFNMRYMNSAVQTK